MEGSCLFPDALLYCPHAAAAAAARAVEAARLPAVVAGKGGQHSSAAFTEAHGQH